MQKQSALISSQSLGSVFLALSLCATAAITSSAFGFPYVSAKFVFIVASALILSVLVFIRGYNFQRPRNKTLGLSLLAVFVFTSIATLSSHTGEQATGVSLIILWVLIAANVSALALAEGPQKFIKNFICLQAPLIALSYLYFVYSGLSSPHGFKLNPFFGNPNIACNFLALSLVSLFFFTKFVQDKRLRLSGYFFILIGVGLLLTLKGRGALVGLFLALAYYLWTFYKIKFGKFSSQQKKLCVAGALAATCILAYVFSQKGMDSMKNRYAFWVNTTCMMKDYPLGVGAGSFEYVFQKYNNTCFPSEEIGEGLHVRNPHNMFLEVSAEIGLLGGIALLLFFFTLYRELKTKALSKMALETTWILCSAIVLAGIGLVEFPQDTPFTFYFMAILMGISHALLSGTPIKQSNYMRIANLAVSLLVFIVFSMKYYSDHITFKPSANANESYKAACVFDSENWRACTFWALAELEAGNTEKTEKIISKLNKKFGDHHSQMHLRGTYAEKRGDMKAVCKEFGDYNARFGGNTSKKEFLEKNCAH